MDRLRPVLCKTVRIRRIFSGSGISKVLFARGQSCPRPKEVKKARRVAFCLKVICGKFQQTRANSSKHGSRLLSQKFIFQSSKFRPSNRSCRGPSRPVSPGVETTLSFGAVRVLTAGVSDWRERNGRPLAANPQGFFRRPRWSACGSGSDGYQGPAK